MILNYFPCLIYNIFQFTFLLKILWYFKFVVFLNEYNINVFYFDTKIVEKIFIFEILDTEPIVQEMKTFKISSMATYNESKCLLVFSTLFQ